MIDQVGILAELSAGFYSEAIMLIFSLILIEGLLSVDNALGIAAMASHLPKHQQKPALRWGIIGAYLFRAIALGTAAWLMSNMWVKWFGAAYLIYLAAKHLMPNAPQEHHDAASDAAKVAGKGFIATIASIELMDLSLSVDNVVAAVAMVAGAKHIPVAYHIWVVCLGVFIGILALRIVAGWCIGLIAKHPILNYTAFLLVGYVGFMLLSEMTLKLFGIEWHSGILLKFSIITVIVVTSLMYEKSQFLHRCLFYPILIFGKLCTIIAVGIDYLFWPIWAPIKLILHKK